MIASKKFESLNSFLPDISASFLKNNYAKLLARSIYGESILDQITFGCNACTFSVFSQFIDSEKELRLIIYYISNTFDRIWHLKAHFFPYIARLACHNHLQ